MRNSKTARKVISLIFIGISGKSTFAITEKPLLDFSIIDKTTPENLFIYVVNLVMASIQTSSFTARSK